MRNIRLLVILITACNLIFWLIKSLIMMTDAPGTPQAAAMAVFMIIINGLLICAVSFHPDKF